MIAFGQCTFKPFVLWAVQANRVEILARQDLKTQRDVVAGADLLHEPADTMSFFASKMLIVNVI